jgi:hypothetical protein
MNKPVEFKTQVAEANNHDRIIDKIVSEMWRLSNRDRLDEVLILQAKKLRKNNVDDTIKSVYDYVVSRVPYKLDPPGKERLTAPIHLINGNRRGEDCDGMVMLLSALLSALGIKSRIKVISWRLKEFTHVTLEAWNGSRWIELDATMKSSGYDVKRRVIGRVQTQDPLQINRFKIYENPMKLEIETLEDNPQNYMNTANYCALACNCGGMSDCGCGGKCKRCGGKKPTNLNINVNPILIGNDLSSFSNMVKEYTGQNPNVKVNPPQIIERERLVPQTKIVERPGKTIEKQVIIDNLERQKSVSLPKEEKRLASAISTKGQTYIYHFGF